MLYDLTYMWNLKQKQKNKLIDTENRWLVIARGGDGVKELKGKSFQL